MTTIGFIRHGITDWNVESRVQGQTDVPLNETGRLQARALAARMKGEPWDAIFASDLSRAKETADIVAKSLGLPVLTDVRLREMHCGEIEGSTLEERIERWGEGWGELSLGIEDENSIAARGLSFIEEVAERFEGRKVLAVSHGALIGVTLSKLVPRLDSEEHLLNTSLSIVKHNGTDWDCELFNCARHLA